MGLQFAHAVVGQIQVLQLILVFECILKKKHEKNEYLHQIRSSVQYAVRITQLHYFFLDKLYSRYLII